MTIDSTAAVDMDVDRIVQSWPMRGNMGVMQRAELQALAAPPKQ